MPMPGSKASSLSSPPTARTCPSGSRTPEAYQRAWFRLPDIRLLTLPLRVLVLLWGWGVGVRRARAVWGAGRGRAAPAKLGGVPGGGVAAGGRLGPFFRGGAGGIDLVVVEKRWALDRKRIRVNWLGL